jgi:ketosteroid isomerase-like protein
MVHPELTARARAFRRAGARRTAQNQRGTGGTAGPHRGGAQVSVTEDIVTQIRQLEDQRFDAAMKGDLDTIGSLFDEELAYTHSNGLVDTRESYLRKCADGFYVYHRVDHPIDRVIVLGEDSAVVVGQMNADITANGVERQLNNNITAVWTRRADGWKLISHASTPRNY